MKQTHFVIILLTLVGFSCSSPQKSFEKGNYEKAFNGALSDLDKRNNPRQNKTLLNKAYQEILYQNDRDNYKLLRTGYVEDLEKVYSNNLDIIDKYHDAKRYLNPTFDSIATEFTARTQRIKEDIAFSYWDQGNILMEMYNTSGDKFKAQDANYHFSKALDYDIQYTSIDSMLDVSFAAGVIHVLVETNVWDLNYSWRVDNTFRNLINLSRGFNQVHYENMISIADCRIDVSFNNVEIFENRTTQQEEYSKEIQDGYTTEVDSSGNINRILKYKRITAQVTKETTTWTYTWRVRSTVRQATPFCSMSNGNFEERGEIVNIDYQIDGDTRAVPEEYQNVRIFNKSSEEEQLLHRMIDNIYDDFVRYYFR